MPTGYTADIQKGIEFPIFVMNCARNFGALVMMRDKPMDAEIPVVIEPSIYHKDEMDKAESKLLEAKKMSLETAKVLSEQEHADAILSNEKTISEKMDFEAKYTAMLDKVKAWQPPTPEHEGMKKFMVEQIESSIEFDCDISYNSEPVLLSPEKWLCEYIDKCAKGLGYHIKEWYAEVDRCKERTEWINQLRKSLVGVE